MAICVLSFLVVWLSVNAQCGDLVACWNNGNGRDTVVTYCETNKDTCWNNGQSTLNLIQAVHNYCMSNTLTSDHCASFCLGSSSSLDFCSTTCQKNAEGCSLLLKGNSGFGLSCQQPAYTQRCLDFCFNNSGSCLDFCEEEITNSNGQTNFNACANIITGPNNDVTIDNILNICQDNMDRCIKICTDDTQRCDNFATSRNFELVDICKDRGDLCAEYCILYSEDCIDYCKKHPEDCFSICDADTSACMDFCGAVPSECRAYCETRNGSCQIFCETHNCTLDFLLNLEDLDSTGTTIVVEEKEINLASDYVVPQENFEIVGSNDELPLVVHVENHTLSYAGNVSSSSLRLTNLVLSRESNAAVDAPILRIGSVTADQSSMLYLTKVDISYNHAFSVTTQAPVSITRVGFYISNTNFYRGSRVVVKGETGKGNKSVKHKINLGDECSRPYPQNSAVLVLGSTGTFENVTFKDIITGAINADRSNITFKNVSFNNCKNPDYGDSLYSNLRHNAFFINSTVNIESVNSDVVTPAIRSIFFTAPANDTITRFRNGEGTQPLSNTEYSLLYPASVASDSVPTVEGTLSHRKIYFDGDFVPCAYTVRVYLDNGESPLPTNLSLTVESPISAYIPFDEELFPTLGSYTFDLNYAVGSGTGAFHWTSARTPAVLIAKPREVDPPSPPISQGLLAVVIAVPIAVLLLAVIIIVAVVIYYRNKALTAARTEEHEEEEEKPQTEAGTDTGTRSAGAADSSGGGGSQTSSRRGGGGGGSASGSRRSGSDSGSMHRGSQQRSSSQGSRGSQQGSRSHSSRSSSQEDSLREKMRRQSMYLGNSIEPEPAAHYSIDSLSNEGMKIQAPVRDLDEQDSYSD